MGLKKKGKKKSVGHSDPRAKGFSRASQVLDIVRTDSTFYVECTDPCVYVGKCIHCNSHLHVSGQGTTSATVEHIMPLAAGGSGTDLRNLALACSSCNSEKGVRHDAKKLNPRALDVVTALLDKRLKRWRELNS